MYLPSLLEHQLTMLACLSFEDLLDEQSLSHLTEYLALSVSQLDGYTRISFTTTGNEPVTYSTVVSELTDSELQSLVFIRQEDHSGV